MTLLEINKKVLQNCLEYTQLDISGVQVVCPYAMNIVEDEFLGLMKEADSPEETLKRVHELYKANNANYGWYRGKGTAKEIINSCIGIATKRGFSLKNATPEGVRIFMNFVGLGVDCSGYVYNVLKKTFGTLGLEKELNDSLNWADREKTGAYKASVDIFSGDSSEVVSDILSIRPLDLVLYKSPQGGYSHCAMIVRNEKELFVTHSTLTAVPNGVRLDKLNIKNGKLELDCNTVLGKTFEQRFDEGLIEFRRLKILNKLDDTGIEPVTSTMSM